MDVEVKGLSVKYINEGRETPALEGLDLSVDSGRICSLIGPSGSGKTTLLYVLSGIIKKFNGKVLLGGVPADPKLQRIGLVTQNYSLLEWKNVYGNAALGMEIKDKKTDKQEISSFLSKIGLTGFERKYPCSLSGGERQRVAIARAFLMKPDILLMDEPFSALDALTRENMQYIFLDVWNRYRPTVIFVTHSVEEAVFLGQKIAIMSAGPGRIEQVLENPLFGLENKRISEGYSDFILAVRKSVETLWKAC